MITDQFIYFFLLMLLSWVFSDKIIPQLAVLAGNLYVTVLYMSTMALDTTIADTSTRYLVMIFPIILYAINAIYFTAQILKINDDHKKGKPIEE